MARSSVSDAGVMCGSPTAPCDNYLEAGRGRVAVRGQLLDHQVTHHLAGAGRQRVSIGWQKWFLPFALIGRVIPQITRHYCVKGCVVGPERVCGETEESCAPAAARPAAAAAPPRAAGGAGRLRTIGGRHRRQTTRMAARFGTAVVCSKTAPGAAAG